MGLALIGNVQPAHAQLIESLLPPSLNGYGTTAGLPVIARPHPEFQPAGIHSGSFVIRPEFSEGLGYSTNATGGGSGAAARGSGFLDTQAAISAASDWSRDSLEAFATIDDHRYFALPAQTARSWAIGGNGSYDIGRDSASLGVAHVSASQSQTEIGALASSQPVTYSVDTVRARYSTAFGRLSITPNIDVTSWRFDNTVVQGQPASQAYRDYNQIQGGVTAAYMLTPQESVLAVLRGYDSLYLKQQAGQPSHDSTSELALVGFDYNPRGALLYRVLAGLERREFADTAQKAHTAPIVEASVIWTPTGRTSVTGTLIRAIEDAATIDAGGYVYTLGRLQVDHEYLRNVQLQGYVEVQNATYLQGGGHQTQLSAGVKATWLITRTVGVFARSDLQSNRSSGGTAGAGLRGLNGGTGSGNFVGNTFLVGLRFSL